MSKNLKILLVSPEYPNDPKGGGIGSYTQIMANNLAELGHHVHVLYRTGENNVEEVSENISFHHINVDRPDVPVNPNPFSIIKLFTSSLISEFKYRRSIAKKMSEIILEHDIDLIESADAVAEIILFNQNKFSHIPLIVRLHTPLAISEIFDKNISEITRRLIRIPERKQMLKASHLSIPSYSAQSLFRKELHLANRPIRVISNPPPLNFDLKEQSKENDFEVLYIGRITRTKGIPLLMETIPLVLKEVPEAQFTLIGGDAGNPEAFKEKVNWLMAMLPDSARAHVNFLGYMPRAKIDPFLKRAAVSVIPSLFEAFGYTCLEAMSYGKAIVSSNHGAMAEMLDQGRCGQLFTPPNKRELADKIIELLKNPELRQELGDLAQKRVLEEYNKDKIMNETVEYYKQCIDEL